MTKGQDYGSGEIHRHRREPDGPDLPREETTLEQRKRHRCCCRCQQNTLAAADWDLAEKTESAQQFQNQRIEIEGEQPKQPDQKCQDHQSQSPPPPSNCLRDEPAKEKIANQIGGDPRGPSLGPVLLSPLWVAAAQHYQESRKCEIKTNWQPMRLVHRAKTGVKANHWSQCPAMVSSRTAHQCRTPRAMSCSRSPVGSNRSG